MALQTALRHARSGLSEKLRADSSVSVTTVDIYRLDPLSHLDAGHVLIYDVETKRSTPFRPYDHEVELIDSWVRVEGEGEEAHLVWSNVHEEKSRQMGITWTAAYVFLWAMTYWPVKLLMQHVDLGRVDDGGAKSTTESFFGKIRHMATTAPVVIDGERYGWEDWMRPTLSFRQSPEHIVTNPLNGSFLVGRGEEDDPARGGTYHAYFGDEFARIPHADQVQASVVSACPDGRFYNSTPFGDDNVYAELRAADSPDMVYLRHHWSIHPLYSRGLHFAGIPVSRQPKEMQAAARGCDKCKGNQAGLEWTAKNPVAHRYPGKLTSPWYDLMVERLLDDELIAQELDISYTRALTARVYPEFSQEVHVVPHIAWQPGVDVEFSFDYGWSPSFTSVGIWQDTPHELRKIGEVEVKEHTPEQVSEAIRLELLNLGVPVAETEPQFTTGLLAVGDPSGEARELGTGESLATMYRKQGFTVRPGKASPRTGMVSLKRLLHGVPKPIRYSRDTCPLTIKHMENNRWPTDRRGRRRPGATKPENDEHNHMCFVEGTTVYTRSGNQAIETIRPGDDVLTRAGWCRVSAAGVRRSAPVLTLRHERGSLTGTSDHPVWVVGDGWRGLGEVARRSDDPCVLVLEIAERDVAVVAEQSSDDPGRVVVIDVETGRPVVRGASTGSLLADGADTVLLLDEEVVLAERDAVLLREPLIADEVVGVGVTSSAGLVGALEATGRPGASASAPGPFDGDAAVFAVAGTELPGVARALCARLVHARIVSVESASPNLVDVYNLTVEGQPEFFANDVLVHNCSADAYYVAWKYPAPRLDTGKARASEWVPDPELPYYRLSPQEARGIEAEASGDRGVSPGMRL